MSELTPPTPATPPEAPSEALNTSEIPNYPPSRGENGLEGRMSRLETKVDKLSDDIHRTNITILQAIADLKTEFVEFRTATVTQLKALSEKIDDGLKHSREVSNILAGIIITGILGILLKLFL
jgi:predicted transcriptional regulator